jgi:NADH-quinone oxidoreductase subunit L
MALAVGVIVAGSFAIPQSLGGTNAIERFLAPSFAGSTTAPAGHTDVTLSRVATLGVMLFSTLVSVVGILLARHVYLSNPALPRQLAARWHGAHALLQNRYYLDELYLATVVRGTIAGARGLFAFDRRVVDGAVDAFGSITRIVSWFSHMFDKHVVDGLVDLVGWMAGRGSFLVRMLQTGLTQNYALVIVLGLFAFLTVFLFAR